VLQHDVVARLFRFQSYLPPAHPDERMEPIQGAYAAHEHLYGPIPPVQVRELVYQCAFKIALGPGSRFCRQQNRGVREPEGDWTAETMREPDVDLSDAGAPAEILGLRGDRRPRTRTSSASRHVKQRSADRYQKTTLLR
jgi:hypothetical protein